MGKERGEESSSKCQLVSGVTFFVCLPSGDRPQANLTRTEIDFAFAFKLLSCSSASAILVLLERESERLLLCNCKECLYIEHELDYNRNT